ncbi:hypothetical protein C0J29_31680 (plasmid) [Mycobacterium paragordonae]|uniref:Helicase ATP-binding domain-containing protein n=1 Tax=Mycobacterium paragordonae TaxID=1389713 RepID=A0ABQ1CFM7_9MYCO|nr:MULTISPECIES: DEAD/DEAH box helicase [Mycobacterium]AYE99528.1 hypothetical protein C0J29_31680 [Mycobacterium paragordonae]GFG83261.1 hypothetical protein MPRG_65370 [Mycobacterium paragordonae]
MISRDLWPVLHEAVTTLAAVCDYANERDSAGFSATDAAVGHFLADTPLQEWADEHAATARVLLPTYRRQLGEQTTAQILSIPDPDAEHARAAREAVRGLHRAARRRQYLHRSSYVHLEDQRVLLAFPFDEALVAAARVIAGRRYDGARKVNSYPLSSLPAVVGLATGAGIDIAPEILAVARDVVHNPDAYRPVEVSLCEHDPALLRIDTDYAPGLTAALKALNGGSTWRSAARVHEIAITVGAAQLLDVFTSHDLVIEASAARALDEAIAQQRNQAGGTADLTGDRRLSIAAATPAVQSAVAARLRALAGSCVPRKALLPWPLHVEPAAIAELLQAQGIDVTPAASAALHDEIDRQETNLEVACAASGPPMKIAELGVTLMAHQCPAVRFAAAGRRILIGDEMGLGKTITALATVAAEHAFPVVVACKPDLTENWRTEITRALPARRVAVASGLTPRAVPAGTDVVVIGYAALASRPRMPTGTTRRFAWVQQLAELGPRALIIDEGHLGKESTAARSRALAALGADVAARDGLILNLTGTAVVNRPRELAQQLITLGLLAPKDTEINPGRHLFGGEWDFLFRYCGPEQSSGGFGWTFNGASHTRELNHRLKAFGVMLRRTEDALDLPEFSCTVLPIEPAQLDPDAWAQYRQAEQAAAADFAREATDLAEAYGVEVSDARVRAAMRARSGAHLVRINALRQLIGAAKQPAITDWVSRYVADGEKVMIAAHHRDVVDHYASRFGGLKIQGGQSVAAKEADKHAFQTCPVDQAPAITVAISAGGVGHTLTAARIGVQAELCWTPGELRQMAKRIHRIGQTRPVQYRVAVVPATIDEQMWQIITNKQRTLDAVLDGVDISDVRDDDTAAAAQLAWELVEAGLNALAEVK